MDQNSLKETIASLETHLKKVEHSVTTIVEPVRQSAFKRFPVFFTLLVTFGLSAVVFGFERLISEVAYLNERPLLILIIGVCILAATGKLYKKL
jgi:hypothetical protein